MSSTALSEKADSSAGTSCWVASSPLMPLSWMRTVGAEAACLVGAARVREVKRRVDARARSVDFMLFDLGSCGNDDLCRDCAIT